MVQEDVGEVPVQRDAGYHAAVEAFGAEEVAAAAANAARVARIALADCVRWRTGVVDPRLAELRYPMGPVTIAVTGAGDAPRLVLTGSFVMDVAFGPTRVQAAQDWVLTSERSDGGWRLAAAATGGAHVNWSPPR